MLAIMAVAFLTLLGSAYFLYGSFIARQFQLDPNLATPARRINDGEDFVPTKPFYLFAQHFSAIAAAGPIVGPILACQSWGWIPCLIWIGVGVVFIGAVHDFSSLTASVRHEAQSIAEIAKERMGAKAGTALMIFIWIALIYVMVAFTDTTAATFTSILPELEGKSVSFNQGGAVAASSILYLLLALIMGILQKYFTPPLWLMTLIFVPATLVAVWCGTLLSETFIISHKIWALLILVYCFVASLIPVWLLLQPRGYLGGFVLYLALALGVFGIFYGGYPIEQDAFKGWNAPNATGATASLFPFLFVTIACGACSGFHGLVCSGTTSKQIDKETHAHPVGYGAMLAEAFVAFIALVTIMIISSKTSSNITNPGTIYGNGIGEFMTLIIGKENRLFAITFGAMVFSTFVFDTLDVCTRLGRYIIQELFQWRSRFGALMGTLFTILPPVYFVSTAPAGSWRNFWTLFGASNQLLAGLTLLVITVWLAQEKKNFWFTLCPMIFVMSITLWSLCVLSYDNFKKAIGWDVKRVNGIVSSVLIMLTLYLLGCAFKEIRKNRVVR